MCVVGGGGGGCGLSLCLCMNVCCLWSIIYLFISQFHKICFVQVINKKKWHKY